MLVCLSAHQRATSFDSLERLSVVGDDAAASLRTAHEAVQGTVVLSTCNRFEAYFDLADDIASPIPAMDAAMERIADLSGLPFRTVRESVDFAQGNRVARHLFAVSAGLDSVAVGEDEIAGQVRRALDNARSEGLTSPSLERLFQRATETSRVVKNATRLGESGRSLVRLAVELASSRVDDWSTARVLLVGTGRYAAASLAALRAVGAADVRVHSRSGRRSFAQREQLVEVPEDAYAAEAARAHVIVTCTTDVVLAAPVHAAARGGDATPQIVIDLGMPRNVDPGVGALPGVELLDLDTIRVHAPMDEFALIDEAREIVASAAHRHAVARRVHEVAPQVVAVRSFVDEALEAEIARVRGKEGAEAIEAALRHFSGVLTHRLIAQGHRLASTGAGTQWADAVRTVIPGAP
ncbi:glutamyl-tRNA reductase [Microbacterium sp. No. 7]|uniref:glutamyl-tRNA reductase n=1 Tax=Microbacterium sp. No. 7 TaxID=1714373 RepID=UPI0006D1E115|nr:glutamyl-tRNA reductase [Microbacterium sp. No. 7]ALJ19752.1 glutamyl-tRNA reductase [Microbacterium sp. No. 7]